MQSEATTRGGEIADLELERSLLATLLADNGGFDKIGGPQPDDLFDPIYASVLAAGLDLRAERRPVNLTTLRSRFAHVPFPSGGSVLDHLKTCEFAGSTPDMADVAAALRDLSQRRDIQRLGEQISGSAHDHGASPASLLIDASRGLDDLLSKCRPAGKTLRTMPEAVDDVLGALHGRDEDKRILTGLTDVDRDTGGWRRGEYGILGGRPSMGKSAVATAVGRRAAKAGHGVAFFSLEMTTRQLMARMITDACWSRDSPIPYSDALRGMLRGRELATFQAGAREVRELPLLIEEQSGLTATDIAARTRSCAEIFARQGKRLGLVIVDHLGLVRPSNRYRGQKVHEVAETSQAMAHLAKSENVAVLCLHQLNRAVEARDNKRPTLSDLRDTGNLEQDADVVMFVYRSTYYLERLKLDDPAEEADRVALLAEKRNDLELSIAKNRNGPTSTIELFCDMAANAVRDKWRGR